MERTKNGFYVSFDTTKRKKYSDKTREEIARLYRLGMSHRKIAVELGIPSGSIYNILRDFKIVKEPAVRPNRYYYTREEAKYLYDITDAQFDYARKYRPSYTVKFNDVVFLHQDYIFDYIEGKKGYSEDMEKQIQAKIKTYLENKGAYVVKVIQATKAGVPDILACYKGLFIGIEVKKPTTKNNVSKLQQHNLNLIKLAEGRCIVAWDVDMVKEFIEDLDK